MDRRPAAPVQEQGRRRVTRRPDADRARLRLRPALEPLRLRRDQLGRDRDAARHGGVALVRQRQQRPRPVRAHPLRRPGLAHDRRRRHGRQPRHRRRLRRHRRLRWRQDRRGDDALRRRALRLALHVLRHPADGRLRPQHDADADRPRRRRVADDGPYRARPDPLAAPQGVHRGGARGRRRRLHHRSPPHHPERARPRHRLRHAHRARDHDHRELPLVLGPRRAGALHLLGRADRRGGGADGIRTLAADLPGDLPRRHPVLLQLRDALLGDGLRDALDPKDR